MDKHGGAYGLVIFSSNILQVMLGLGLEKGQEQESKEMESPCEKPIELFHLAILDT